MGNMAYANGCLAIAGPKELFLYTAPARQRAAREFEVLEHPASAKAHLRLGVAQADANLYADASVSFRRAEQLLKSENPAERATIGEALGAARHQLLLDTAVRTNDEQAAKLLELAAGLTFSPLQRVDACQRLATVCMKKAQWAKAIAAWQDILEDPSLRETWTTDAEGSRRKAARVAEREIDRLLYAHGREFYDVVEKRAQQRFDALATNRSNAVGALAVEFPHASITQKLLNEAAASDAANCKYGAAASAYRTLLRHARNQDQAATIQAQLAKAYEAEQCWAAARSTWEALVRVAGDQVLPSVDPGQPLRAIVSERLRRPEFQSFDSATIGNRDLPLFRNWELALKPAERMLVLRGLQALGQSEEILLFVTPASKGGRLTCRDARSGSVKWQSGLSFVPTWAGSLADTLVVAGENEVTCLRRQDGHPLWGFTSSGPLSSFSMGGSRLFMLEAESRLLALDMETGDVAWNQRAPGAGLGLPAPHGQFGVNFTIVDDRLLLQTGNGRRWLVDEASGRLLDGAGLARQPWPQAPLLGDQGRIYLAADPSEIVCLDAHSRKEIWRQRLDHPVSRTGELPGLVRAGEHVLVLAPRSHGTGCLLIDGRTGAARWPDERLINADKLTTQQVACDHAAFYFAAGNELHAHALQDGRFLWHSPILAKGTRWSVSSMAKSVLVYPQDALRVQFQILLTFHSVEWFAQELVLNYPFSDAGERTFTAAFFDSQTGQVVQRLNLPLEGPNVAASNMPSLERGVRIDTITPVVHPVAGGFVVSVPGKACRFANSLENPPRPNVTGGLHLGPLPR